MHHQYQQHRRQNFAISFASVVDPIGKFATGVNATYGNDTGGAPWAANISANLEKIRNGPNGILRGLGETDSWKKPEIENLVTLFL